jgi:rod shape-determining protein MreC
VTPAVGSPGDLIFEPVDSSARVREGEIVSTAGTTSDRLLSRYPPAIVIGVVDKIDLGDGELDTRIHLKPVTDLLRVELVQVLTEPHADLDGAR